MKTFQISFLCAMALLLGACDDEVTQPSQDEEQGPSSVGMLVDKRDGQTYRTVTIGSQTWMAENLNYVTSDSYDGCSDTSSCPKYGRRYKWAAAVGRSQVDCGLGNRCALPSGDIQGVCPDGWHLPSDDDWYVLISTAGGPYMAGYTLRSTTSNWTYKGSDQFSFSILTVGSRGAAFWTSTEVGDSRAFSVHVCDGVCPDEAGEFATQVYIYDFNGSKNVKDMAMSVRCVKNNGMHVTFSSLKGESSAFTDSRDGQVYKAVRIGKQTWMAQNLNYQADSSFCYDDDEDKCTKYGRLYTWNAALNACPMGWHLPAGSEWLFLSASLASSEDLNRSQIIEYLTSISGWSDGYAGDDLFGFSALPAGYGGIRGGGNWGSIFSYDDVVIESIEEMSYQSEGDEARFWSSTATEFEDANAFFMSMDFDSGARLGYGKISDRLSVRCVKD